MGIGAPHQGSGNLAKVKQKLIAQFTGPNDLAVAADVDSATGLVTGSAFAAIENDVQ